MELFCEKDANCFCKKLHHRRLIGSYISLWSLFQEKLRTRRLEEICQFAVLFLIQNKPLNDQLSHHIEISHLICSANQLTSFYTIGTLVVKQLIVQIWWVSSMLIIIKCKRLLNVLCTYHLLLGIVHIEVCNCIYWRRICRLGSILLTVTISLTKENKQIQFNFVQIFFLV